MRRLVVCIFLMAGLALAAPPQVKRVSYTYNATKIEFWYPTLIDNGDGLNFSSRMTISESDGNTSWSRDKLRSRRFLCGLHDCKVNFNSIAKDWSQNNETLARIQTEIAGYQEQIARKQIRQSQVEQYIKENQCSSVSSGPEKPAFACSTDDVEEVATTLCAIREFGAKLCEKGGKDVLDFDAPKFFKDALAREGCAAAIHEVIGEEYSLLDKTINKYTVDLPITIISEVIGSFWKAAKEVFDWSIAFTKTRACLPSGAEICRRKYSVWQTSVTEHFATYSENIKLCVAASEELGAAKAEIERDKQHIAVGERLTFERIQLKREIQSQFREEFHPHALQSM